MIAVGPGARDNAGKVVSPSVKAGDKVLLPGWGGNPIKVGEEVRSIIFRSGCLVLMRGLFFFLFFPGVLFV